MDTVGANFSPTRRSFRETAMPRTWNDGAFVEDLLDFDSICGEGEILT